MTEFVYRAGTIKDLEQVRDLTLLAYGQYKDVITKENREEWESYFKDDNTFLKLFKMATCFICEYESEIIGTAFLIPHGNPNPLFQDNWAYIRLVGVNPKCSGLGIGRKLTMMCIGLAKASGEKVLALHTSEFQNASRHIYESLGFERQREFEKFGKKYWVYTLDLKNTPK